MTLLLFFVCPPPLCFVLLLQIRRQKNSIDRQKLIDAERKRYYTDTENRTHTQILLSMQRNRLNDDDGSKHGEDSKRIKIILKLINTQLKFHLIQRGAKNKYNNTTTKKKATTNPINVPTPWQSLAVYFVSPFLQLHMDMYVGQMGMGTVVHNRSTYIYISTKIPLHLLSGGINSIH